MAYFQRRRGRQVTVYYYDARDQRTKRLPRSQTRELDGWQDDQVRAWVEAWETASGPARERSRARSSMRDDELSRLFEVHLTDHKVRRDPIADSLRNYRGYFEGYVKPYFVQKLGLQDPRAWWQHTDSFVSWLLIDRRRTVQTVRKICDALSRFGRFLVRRGVLTQPWLIEKPRSKGRRPTPLSKKWGPGDAIALARVLLPSSPNWALEVLLSYFGSLRPEEVYALSREDLLTGDTAKRKAKTYLRFQRYGLGSGLSIFITKTLVKRDVQELTKTHYARGIVNVWDAEAAKLAAQILRDSPEGRLFAGTRWQINRQYRQIVRPLCALNAQDRRRASANYLGKEIGVDPILLQDHLRHSELSTTMLYVRDPTIRETGVDVQDFDDVV